MYLGTRAIEVVARLRHLSLTERPLPFTEFRQRVQSRQYCLALASLRYSPVRDHGKHRWPCPNQSFYHNLTSQMQIAKIKSTL